MKLIDDHKINNPIPKTKETNRYFYINRRIILGTLLLLSNSKVYIVVKSLMDFEIHLFIYLGHIIFFL